MIMQNNEYIRLLRAIQLLLCNFRGNAGLGLVIEKKTAAAFLSTRSLKFFWTARFCRT